MEVGKRCSTTLLLASLSVGGACAAGNPSAEQASDTGDAETDETDTGGAEPDALDEFFSLESIHVIELTLDDAGRQSLLDEPKVYVEAGVTIDGEHYDGIGLRLKGSAGSFVPLDGDYPEISGDGNGNPGKSAFIVDFNRYAPGQDHLGLKKLTINNLVQDASGIHEFLGYSLFREGDVPASRSGFATVSLDGEVKGIYAIIETPDNDVFLESWFGNDDGNLYEGQYGTDFVPGRWQEFDQDSGTDDSLTDVEALTEALAAIEGEADILPTLQTHFDFDAYLAFAVTEIYLGHWDGYAQSANNFAIHHDLEGGKWTFLPWGIDQLFIDDMGPYSGVMRAPGPTWGEQGGIVHQLCMSSADCRALLYDAFVELFDRVEDMDYASLAAAARELVEEAVVGEAQAHGDPELTATSYQQIDDHMANRRDAIEPWLPCLIGETVDRDEDLADDCDEDCGPGDPGIHPGAEEQCNFIDDDCNGVVDDPAECPHCLEFDGPGAREYLLCFEQLGWLEARQDCVDQGGDLASIHDMETAEVLAWTMIDVLGVEEAWIGLNDAVQEGEFVWSDGSDFDFDHWGGEAPTQGPEAEEFDCVGSTPWGWWDRSCGEPRGYVCLLP